MKLLVGLGNPGPKYETTRHNAGFLVLDQIVDQCGLRWEGQQFQGIFARGAVDGESCLLLKPQTFMNLSGRSVAQAMRFYKVSVDDVVVFHDDIDVPAGVVRARAGGGHGGHNGIRSIIAEVGAADFHRIKLGVERPPARPNGVPGDVADWLLSPMRDDELKALAGPMFTEAMARLKGIFQQARAKNRG